MKKRLYIVVFIISLVLISNVIAYQSTITVKTGLPKSDITLRVADPDTGKTIQGGILTATADDSGIVVFNYNLKPQRIKMGFTAWSGEGPASFLSGQQVFIPNVILDKFIDINLNAKEYTIEVYNSKNETEEVVEESNKTIVEEVANKSAEITNKSLGVTNETNESEEIIKKTGEVVKKSESPITGFTLLTKTKDILLSTKTYYIFGGILILFILTIFIKKKMNKKGTFKVTKLSELQANKEKMTDTSEELADAERKLKEAKEELDNIKNKKSKLQEARDRLKKDKEELKRLERN